MEQSHKFLHEINVPTGNYLTSEIIQELLVLTKDRKTNLNKEYWDDIAQKLWQHLEKGFEKQDDQLLCATCFYSAITLAENEDYYLDKLLNILILHQRCKQLRSGNNEESIDIRDKMQSLSSLQVVSLMYGMFQSSFLIQKRNYNTTKISEVLKEIFDILLQMAYEYSQYTFLAFKTIKSFKKLCGGSLEKCIFNQDNQIKLLALVNHNWENPVTGVRDMNRYIFQTVISTLDTETYERVVHDIDGFYWNKAKFLMLSEIIESYNGDIMALVSEHEKWVDGLMYSLHKPGLVSAGADMYYSLLKKMKTQNDWCQLFLSPILNILNGTSSKAIENFTNYWCLTTMKKFGSVFQVLTDELVKLKDSEQLLYSKLCVVKQANKLGMFDKNWNSTNENTAIARIVHDGIEHYNCLIRMLAFDIVCVSQGKSIPSKMEYNLILDYLHNNVNSDSTVLRLSMFSSFNTFLIQLHSIFLNIILKNNITEALENLLMFFVKLQNFIVKNFNINGNYQRKITSVKLCNAVLMYLSVIPKKRKDQTRQADVTLIGYLKQKECWVLSTEHFITKLISLLKDPADDVRENATKILSCHYAKELHNITLINQIIDNAKMSMSSKFFYEISCGQSMFKLIINLLIKEKELSMAEYKTVEHIFHFAYDELITQHAAKTNVMESIESGKQLHSSMSILLVVLEECISNSHKLNIDDKMPEFLDVLESISNQFAWEEEGSSDFSKMNDMVQSIIDSSNYNSVDKEDHSKISGLQQIVLNCLWLSVKASCELASVLVQYNVHNIEMCEKCLNIITRVLETSRHKGAIEAAGAALGRGIQFLTSLPEKDQNILAEENDVSKLPFILLNRKLNDLICETNKMSSITRRGAGLSIMVHRIVSSDMKRGKPLFHYFIKTLLRICNTKDQTAENYRSNMKDDNMENQVDLPKAIYIHFMTRIVTDSSLATDMMYYSVELAELAFGNLTSPHWQIRNAALQLYGALIPRLIGQKKASGTDDETIATVACDEMRTHLPQLWQYITEQLKQNCGQDILQTHSNLVPILNMLASSAKRYNFSLHKEQDVDFYDLFPHLILLLSSPIYTVRRLAARTIFNIYDFEFISNGVLKQKNITENLLHGLLLLFNLCKNYYSSEFENADSFRKLKNQFCEMFKTGSHSYVCKKLFEDFIDIHYDMKVIENTLLELTGNIEPGVQIWAEARLSKYINKCLGNDIPSLLKQLLQLSDHEKYCEMLLTKIEAQTISNDVLLEVSDVLTLFENKYCSCTTWKMFYRISQKCDIQGHINSEELLDKLEESNTYNLRYSIPLIARNIKHISFDNQTRLMKIINDLGDFENADVDMRQIAATANNEIAHWIETLTDSLKVISIKCAVLLLQDEDEDVRNLSVNFYSTLYKEGGVIQPYICLNKILDRSFLRTVFYEPESAIQELITKISDVFNLNHNVDAYNPFANDSKNIYFEPELLKQMIENFSD